MTENKRSFCFSQRSESLATTVDIAWEISKFSLYFLNKPMNIKSEEFINESSGTRYSLEFAKIDYRLTFCITTSARVYCKLRGSFNTKGGKQLQTFYQLTERIKCDDLLYTIVDDFLKVCLHIDEPYDQTLKIIENPLGNVSPAETLLSNFSEMFEKKELCDLSLRVCNKEIPVHKTILAASSPVFAAMFKHKTLEKSQNRINIVDFDYGTVTRLVRFMYTCKAPEFAEIDVEGSMELLKIADKYQIDYLKTCCSNHLMSTLNIVDVPKLLQLAYECNLTRLKEQCLELLSQKILTSDFVRQLQGNQTLMTEVILQSQEVSTLK